MFLMMMALSTMIAISSMSWFVTWIGLEINLLSIMPLMKSFKDKYATEATIKYFIIQAMASSILLLSIIMFISTSKLGIEYITAASLVMNTALLLKLGAAPFHFWFPEVISGLNWEMVFILMTWQKIAPMILLSYSTHAITFLSIIIIFSSMVSGLQGINQTCLRKILAYSSINHVSWMIAAILNSVTVWVYYFIIYCIINTNILVILYMHKIYFINQLSMIFSKNKKIKFFFMLNFLSLGGLPPFLGFFPKWITMNFMIKNEYYTLSVILIIFTLISLYFYLRITFSSFNFNSEESLIKIFNKMSFFQFFTNLISLMGLVVCSIYTNFL
uniref:NADH-ubiquinone oxidoreductase chain 2 n=1 Tax=Dorytomus tortrix TaxID=1342005 RepID=A0A343C4P7_9CUCU|nr:NADH dehydrogenase subunit 2 [Dorytomus tortrix]